MRVLTCILVAFVVTAASSAHAQYFVPEVTTAGAVTVDGDLSDWSGATWIPLDQVYAGTVTDLTNASWAARWSNTNNLIYVAVKGTDSFQWFVNQYVSATGQDDVEVYVDASNSNSNTFRTANPPWNKAQQYIAGPNTSGGTWITLAGNSITTATVPAFASKVTGPTGGPWQITYEFAFKPFDTYNFFSPGSSTTVDLYPGRILGLDVVMSTKDASGTFGGLCNNLNRSKWRDASKFMDVQLVDASTHITPIHKYTFNGDCNDSMGTAHGTLVNSTGLAQFVTTNGQTSLVLGNDGSQTNSATINPGDYVLLPSGLISGMSSDAVTLEFWVKFASQSRSQNYFTFGQDFAAGETNPGQFLLGIRNDYKAGATNDWGEASKFQWNVAGLGDVYYSSRTGTDDNNIVYPFDQEVQVVISYDSASLTSTMFLHGVPVVTYKGTDPTKWPSFKNLVDSDNYLGRGFVDEEWGFVGSFNEVVVYDRALLPSEVLNHWQQGPTPSGTVSPITIEDPVHLWAFNDSVMPGKDSKGSADAILVNGTGNAHWLQQTGHGGRPNGYWMLGQRGDATTLPLSGPGENGDYVKLPAELIPSIGSNKLTFEIWLYFNDAVDTLWDTAIFQFGMDGGATASEAYNMFLKNRNMDDYDWDHKWNFGWSSGRNAWNYVDVMQNAFSPPADPKQEVQYVCTYDYDSRRTEVYINGVFRYGYSSIDRYKWVDFPSTDPTHKSWVGNNPDNWLGRAFEDAKQLLPVTFDEFRIYNRVLTDKEIAARYTQGPADMAEAPPTCGNPVVDLNKDNRVDSQDLDIFRACANGPRLPRVDTFQCSCADVNVDGSLDSVDFAAFQRCLNDGTIPIVSGCAN